MSILSKTQTPTTRKMSAKPIQTMTHSDTPKGQKLNDEKRIDRNNVQIQPILRQRAQLPHGNRYDV